VRTFFVGAISGGTLSRAAIGATPFLLPLMFQVCLGYSPAASGGLLMVYMGGNLAMKAVTNPILRRFGFRQALIVNGLVASVAIALCAAISAHMAWPLTFAILLLAGASRSMQFTAITMVGFADLNDADRPAASTLFSLAQQIGMSLGIAVGALVLSLSQIFRGVSSLGLLDVRLGLLIAAAFSALATISYRSLAPDAGATISGHKMA
jgi:Na+/melibiose symporter-like transporter